MPALDIRWLQQTRLSTALGKPCTGARHLLGPMKQTRSQVGASKPFPHLLHVMTKPAHALSLMHL